MYKEAAFRSETSKEQLETRLQELEIELDNMKLASQTLGSPMNNRQKRSPRRKRSSSTGKTSEDFSDDGSKVILLKFIPSHREVQTDRIVTAEAGTQTRIRRSIRQVVDRVMTVGARIIPTSDVAVEAPTAALQQIHEKESEQAKLGNVESREKVGSNEAQAQEVERQHQLITDAQKAGDERTIEQPTIKQQQQQDTVEHPVAVVEPEAAVEEPNDMGQRLQNAAAAEIHRLKKKLEFAAETS